MEDLWRKLCPVAAAAESMLHPHDQVREEEGSLSSHPSSVLLKRFSNETFRKKKKTGNHIVNAYLIMNYKIIVDINQGHLNAIAKRKSK